MKLQQAACYILFVSSLHKYKPKYVNEKVFYFQGYRRKCKTTFVSSGDSRFTPCVRSLILYKHKPVSDSDSLSFCRRPTSRRDSSCHSEFSTSCAEDELMQMSSFIISRAKSQKSFWVSDEKQKQMKLQGKTPDSSYRSLCISYFTTSNCVT